MVFSGGILALATIGSGTIAAIRDYAEMQGFGFEIEGLIGLQTD